MQKQGMYQAPNTRYLSVVGAESKATETWHGQVATARARKQVPASGHRAPLLA